MMGLWNKLIGALKWMWNGFCCALKWIKIAIISSWNYVQALIRLMIPFRYSMVTIILISSLFFNAAGKDLLLSLADDPYDAQTFFSFLIIWCISIWYFSRQLSRIDHDDFFSSLKGYPKKHKNHWNWLQRITPRALGFLPFGILALAFPLAAGDYLGDPHFAGKANIGILSACSLGLGVLFLVFISSWRKWLQWREDEAAYGPKKNLFDVGKPPLLKGWWNRLIPPWMQKMLWWLGAYLWAVFLIIEFVGFFGLIWFDPQNATKFGIGPVLFMAMVGWVSLANFLMSLGKDCKFPVLTLAVLWAVVISPIADNHQVRTIETLEADTNTTWDQRLTVEQDFLQWLNSRPQHFNDRKIRPVFFISAEGGGIRAAYWTANLLAAFQDANPRFAEHVYALSGVSGGSLGTALFVNLIKNQNKLNCPDPKAEWKPGEVRKCTHAVLSEDFLAPTIASLLYPDLMQRFNPFPFKFPDRAFALETSFEKGWEKHLDNHQFSESFLGIWDSPDKRGSETPPRLPSLFLNSTWVEGGNRIITSNVKIAQADFPDAEDLLSILCRDMPLSTAVHNSARFSYVSPAGTVEEPVIGGKPCQQLMKEANAKKEPEKIGALKNIKAKLANGDADRKDWGHLVDGGYFENSGNTTTYDILKSLEIKLKPQKHLACSQLMSENSRPKYVPVVVTLINDPKLADPTDANKSQDSGELLSPLKTLFQTRDSRGSYARESIKKYVNEQICGVYIEFKLNDQEGVLPLSWVLSEPVKNNIQEQVNQALAGLARDPLNMATR